MKTAMTKQAGCAQCNCNPDPTSDACLLTCLERPRFFAGQLLTDTELTALVDWTRQRLALSRYTAGWGIVQGLGLRATDARLILEPGYAISCCGEDIMVCKEQTIDVMTLCNLVGNACEDPAEQDNPGSPDAKMRVFDLSLHYAEVKSRAQTVQGRGNCRSVSCEPSRVQETGQVMCKPVKPEGDGETAQDIWQQGYDNVFGFVRDFYKTSAAQNKNVEGAQIWLREAVRNQPWHLFPKVAAGLNAAVNNRTWDEVEQWVVCILQERMHVYLSGIADVGELCKLADGIPLGRVWLERTEAGGWMASYVNTQPPYRRGLRQDMLDRPNRVYLGAALLQTLDVARDVLGQHGVRDVKETAIKLSEFVRMWGGATNAPSLFASPGQPMQLQTVDVGVGPFGPRVLACVAN